ncbi:MAG: 4Fe-4S binding protein [Leptospirales bacterium]|nr:4Fe-4S binding protein [Leptospirales bacterium]
MRKSLFFTFTKTISRNFFKKPATLMYPFKKREFYPATRGRIFTTIEQCIFCGLCSRKCPTNAITVTKESKEFELRSLQCIICGSCVEACPKKCLIMENQYSSSVVKNTEGVYHYKLAENQTTEQV